MMKKNSSKRLPATRPAAKTAASKVTTTARATGAMKRAATEDHFGQLRLRALERLMREREEVMTLYFRVAGVDPVDTRDPDDGTLKKFCHVLVDYLAAGHVTVLDPLLARRPNRAVMEEINGSYPRLSEATEVALAFADRYRDAKHNRAVARYAHDLSDLGEQLAVRVDIEDRLIPLLAG
jgi:regulator of sigma D